MSKVEELSRSLLADLLADFSTRRLGATDLHKGYVGLSLAGLRERYCDVLASSVDFDLALKDLEKANLVQTGPSVPYDNSPNSGLFIIGSYSKREYVYLSEAGYKSAQDTPSEQRGRSSAVPHVHISGGTFHQSPIGIGSHITQSVTGPFGNAPVFANLKKALDQSDISDDHRIELSASIEAMESSPDRHSLFDRYNGFITAAANHMTLFGPLLPALTELLK